MLNKSAFCKIVTQDQLACLHINHPIFFAEICFQGAQLTQFVPKNESAFIWLSPESKYKKQQGLRGGIPICWPWFGALEKNPSAIKNQTKKTDVAHGFVRTLDWKLTDINESAHGVEIIMTISHDAQTLDIWPFEFDLQCHFKLSKDLEMSLTTVNRSNKTMNYSQALHSYFPTNDIQRTKILGSENQLYIDALDDWSQKRQKGTIGISEETDRIYFGKSEYNILTPNHLTRVVSNSQSSVIWNPWVEKSKRLSQFPENGFESMLCIESANVLDDHVSLAPSNSHTLTVNISR